MDIFGRQHGRAVKALDSKSNGLCPRGFESLCCRIKRKITKLIFTQIWGGLAQSEEHVVSNDEAPGSKPGFSTNEIKILFAPISNFIQIRSCHPSSNQQTSKAHSMAQSDLVSVLDRWGCGPEFHPICVKRILKNYISHDLIAQIGRARVCTLWVCLNLFNRSTVQSIWNRCGLQKILCNQLSCPA